jgi:hypothetical protein
MITARRRFLVLSLSLSAPAALLTVLPGRSLHAEEAKKPTAPAAGGDLKVLFVGNSYTFVNDLPAMLAELAKAGGQPAVVHKKETPGGCSLEKHWKDGKAAKLIQEGKWDVVVLQDHSLGALKAKDAMFEYGKKLDAEVKAKGARTVLYMTWARANTPETQKDITAAYEELGKELGATVAPVGRAWQKSLAENPALALHVADKSHPTPAGTYLAACTFCATLFGKSPEGLAWHPPAVSEEDARKLQAIAWAVAKPAEKGEKGEKGETKK